MNFMKFKSDTLKVVYIILLQAFVFNAVSFAQTEPFIPVNGMTIGPNYIVFEAEATESPLGKWQIITPEDSRYKTASVAPINETHLEFTGNDHNFGPATSPLVYEFECPKTGTYRLGGRLYQRLEGQPDDKCNDVYIRMAGNFTSANSIPTSVLKTNQKFFGRGVDKWGALYSIDTHNYGQAPVLYNLTEGEIYTFTVSGRAQRTNVDYWILYDNSISYTLGAHKDIAVLNNSKYHPKILDSKIFDSSNMKFESIEGYADAQTENIAGKEILQNPNLSAWSAAQIVYRGTTGNADFILKTMLEKGGESTYRLKVNGEQITEFTNDRIFGTETENYSIQTHYFNNNVVLKDGDIIQVEFNNTTNGLVSEGDSTAVAHGIFLNLEIRTTGEFTNIWTIQHPVIWATAEEKPEILDKIANYSWAQSIVDKLRVTVDGKVNTHVSNPAAILNTIPAIPADDNLSESQSTTHGDHTKVLTYASYAGMLYYLTEEEKYAQFAADILSYYIDELAPRSPETTTICGNTFYDPRTSYAHFAIAYDFVYQFLKEPGTEVYKKSSGTKVAFDNVKAQKAVHNIAVNALQEFDGADTHGRTISNHPVLRAPGVLFSILNVEDDIERERLFNVFWETGTKEQNSFKHTILPMFGEQGIWPEAVSYSFMPNITLVLNVVDRVKPEMNVMADNLNILEGNFLFDNLRLPNRRFVRYGDSHRDNDGTGALYRYTLNLATRRGFTEYVQKAKVALRQSYDAEGGYNPAVPVSTFDNYRGYEQLLWGVDIPDTIEGEIDFQKPTVIIKHAGVALQRNYVEEANSTYGLCGIIGGAHYVHSHCTGITMELYGAGYVMAANAGLPNTLAERSQPEHEKYFRLYAGNNTVIVNGTSHGIQSGSWKGNSYLWQNTTVNVAAEPKHLEDPISENFSFATQFLDDKVNNDQQQRTLSTIRTSETTGYYFDMFRSKSLGENKFHDYIYHNIGDRTVLSNQVGEVLGVSPTNRYQNDIGDPVQSPGWRFFENTEVTEPVDKTVKAQFQVNYNNRFMNMYVPGGVEREFTKALAPPTREARNGYDDKKTQVLAIRQQGEAWDKPYVAIFEPTASTTSSIAEVEHLYDGEVIVGAKVKSEIGNKTVEDYILCLPGSNSSVTLQNGIFFSGRFAVVRYEQDLDTAYTTLYIGEGESLVYGDISLVTDATKKGMITKGGKPYFGRQLFFKNIENKEVFPKGTNLSIEAIVGEELTNVTLWLNDTINLGTKAEEPYIWSDHPGMLDIQDDSYIFTLTASDSLGQIVRKTIVIETPSQKPYPDKEMPHLVPGKIEFEEYDSGGEGLGYYDKSTQDLSLYTYRDSADFVDLGRNSTVVTDFEEGEWLEYTVDVLQSGYYKLSIRHRTTVTPGVQGFSVLLPNSGDTLLSNIETLYTGRSDFYVDAVGEIFLKQGKQVLRFSILNTGFDLDYFELEFTKATNANMVTQESKQIEVYPNPASETVNINLNGFSTADVSIYNLEGRLMFQESVRNNTVRLSRESDFKPGMYLIRVLDENKQTYYKKLIFK
jgi:hypothetical protein